MAAVEVVRGRLSDQLADEILAFWAGHQALPEEAARRRLPEVVCVARDAAGKVAGVNSVFAEDVSTIGGRSFWVYRSLIAESGAGAWPELFNEAFAAVEREFETSREGPVGLCVGIAERAEMELRPEAVWEDTALTFAGYTQEGVQLRIRYFDDATIGPGLPNSPTQSERREAEYPLEDRYSLAPFQEADVDPEDVLDLWRREQVLTEAQATQRIHDVHLVATERDGGVVGVSSAYLKRNEQLRMNLWYYRAYVSKAHRESSLAAHLAVQGRDVLEDRFVSGGDTRAPGIVYEVENDGVKRYFNRGLWLHMDFIFIGENQRGDHVRVHWFPGARVPPP